jgi:hypothetical protein
VVPVCLRFFRVAWLIILPLSINPRLLLLLLLLLFLLLLLLMMMMMMLLLVH